MKKDYSDWEIVEEIDTPDYSEWEVIEGDGSTPTPPQRGSSGSSGPDWGGVVGDIGSGLGRIPGNLIQGIMGIPGLAKEVAALEGMGLKRFGQNALAGLAQGGHQLLNIPSNIANYAAERNFISPELAQAVPRHDDYNYRFGVGLHDEKPGDALLESLFKLSTTAVAGGPIRAAILNAVGANENPIEAVGNILATKAIGSGLSKAGSAIKNQVFPSAGYVAEKAAPGLTEAELLARQRAAQGTNTPIGDIIGSSDLKRKFENKASKGLGSGGAEKLAELENQVMNKSEKVLQDIGGQYAGQDPNLLTKSVLDKAYKNQQSIKANLYKTADSLAEKEGLKLKLPKFTDKASDVVEYLEKSPVAQMDPTMRKVLNQVNNVKSGIGSNPEVSFKDAKFLSSYLSEKGSVYGASSVAAEREAGKLFKKLATSLKTDIKQEVAERGSEALKKSIYIADRNYAKNYSGFLEKDVVGLLAENKNADAIVREIIQSGKTYDKFTRIKKVQNLLPESERNLMGHALLQPAITETGMLDPREVNKVLKGLGPRQLEALFPDPKVRADLKDLKKLYSLNSEALNRMFNPQTGARNVEGVNALKDIGGAIAAGQFGGTAAGLGALAGKAAHNKYITNKFTDELFRDEVINRILNKNPNPLNPMSSGNELNKALHLWLNNNRRED